MSSPLPFNPSGQTVYEQIGGDETFLRLVEAFYARIEQDDVLRPLFPDDLEEGKENQYLFLAQYWGGPPRYEAKQGHPRLRMRHAPFPIDEAARDRWVAHMVEAMREVGIPEPVFSQMREYFERGASHMINQQ